MYEKLCLWKDLQIIGSTTFIDCKEWDEQHPLYRCLECDGFDDNCSGYKPLSNIKTCYSDK